jgi:hypothetical protein
VGLSRDKLQRALKGPVSPEEMADLSEEAAALLAAAREGAFR